MEKRGLAMETAGDKSRRFAMGTAALQVRAAHPDRPDVTVTATLRMASQADAGACRVEYEVRAAGNGFLPWHGTGPTLQEAVDDCLADMAQPPEIRLRAEAGAMGFDLVRRGAVTL